MHEFATASAGGSCHLGSNAGVCHPSVGLTAEEYQKIDKRLREQNVIATDDTLFPLIELKQPAKARVLMWKGDDKLDRRAAVQFSAQGGFRVAGLTSPLAPSRATM